MPEIDINVYHEPYTFGLNLPDRFSPPAAHFAQAERNWLRAGKLRGQAEKYRQEADLAGRRKERAKRIKARKDAGFKMSPESARSRARALASAFGYHRPKDDPKGLLRYEESISNIQRIFLQDPKWSPSKEDFGKAFGGTRPATPGGKPGEEAAPAKEARAPEGTPTFWLENLVDPGYSMREMVGAGQGGPKGKPAAADVVAEAQAPAAEEPVLSMEELIEYRETTGEHHPSVIIPDPEKVKAAKKRGWRPLGQRVQEIMSGKDPRWKAKPMSEEEAERIHRLKKARESDPKRRVGEKTGAELREEEKIRQETPSIVDRMVPDDPEETMRRVRAMKTAGGVESPGGLRELAERQGAIERVKAARVAERFLLSQGKELGDINPFRRSKDEPSLMERAIEANVQESKIRSREDAVERWEERGETWLRNFQKYAKKPVALKNLMLRIARAEGHTGKRAARQYDEAFKAGYVPTEAELRYLIDREARIIAKASKAHQADVAASEPPPPPEVLTREEEEAIQEERGTSIYAREQGFPWGSWEAYKANYGFGQATAAGTATKPTVDPEIVRQRSQGIMRGLVQEAGADVKTWSPENVEQAFGAVVDALMAGGRGGFYYVPGGGPGVRTQKVVGVIKDAIKAEGTNFDQSPDVVTYLMDLAQRDPQKAQQEGQIIMALKSALKQHLPDEDRVKRLRSFVVPKEE